jgi:alkylated DNA repair dioxygenase AlkB
LNHVPRDGDVTYVARFLAPEEAARAFAVLREGLAWAQPQILLFGRRVPSPRLEAWYGDPGACYAYSGLAHDPLPWTPLLCALRDRIAESTGSAYNSVLANLYRDGSDSNGWHADDERELGPEPVIASLSLGAARRFLLRHRADRSLRRELVLEPGSLLVMRGRTQQCWHHAVPKTRSVHEPRINLTFRSVAVR